MCQHGPKECRGNTIHNCVLQRLDESKAQVDYVNCAMYNPDQLGYIENTVIVFFVILNSNNHKNIIINNIKLIIPLSLKINHNH